jgi:hypothetical protein
VLQAGAVRSAFVALSELAGRHVAKGPQGVIQNFHAR